MIEWMDFSKRQGGKSLEPYKATITYKEGNTYLLYFGGNTPEINESEYLQIGKISGSIILNFNNEGQGVKLTEKGRKRGRAVSFKSVIVYLLKELNIDVKEETHVELALIKVAQFNGNYFTIQVD